MRKQTKKKKPNNKRKEEEENLTQIFHQIPSIEFNLMHHNRNIHLKTSGYSTSEALKAMDYMVYVTQKHLDKDF